MKKNGFRAFGNGWRWLMIAGRQDHDPGELAGKAAGGATFRNQVIARAQSWKGLAEEQPKAYKNVDDVVDVVDRAGLSKKVARMRPIGVIKG